jgi:hypothetical protein
MLAWMFQRMGAEECSVDIAEPITERQLLFANRQPYEPALLVDDGLDLGVRASAPRDPA